VKLVSINTGRGRPLRVGDGFESSGIVKEPVPEAYVDSNGLRGDEQADRRHHGGVDQAVYLYSLEDYAWWEAELGRTLAPGTFGENLTVDTLSPPVKVGDRYHFGAVVLEVTAPRIPCHKLAARMGDPGFVKRFSAAGRPGCYARVLRNGTLTAGERFSKAAGSSGLSVEALAALYLDKAAKADALERALATPLAERTRRHFKERLKRSQALK
jgi:MOSC domain-containing protein YiiM